MGFCGLILLMTVQLDRTPYEWWQQLGSLFEEGRQLYARGEYGAAAERFSRSLPATRDAGFYNRALCHARLGRWTLARADFANALQTSRELATRQRATLALAVAEIELAQTGPALRRLTELARNEPSWPAIHLNRARALAAAGHPGRAAAALQPALAQVDAPTRDRLRAWILVLAHQQRQRAAENGAPFLGSLPSAPAAWPARLQMLRHALAVAPHFAPARQQLAALRTAAESENRGALVQAIDAAIEADEEATRPTWPLPPFDLEPLDGRPDEPADASPTWESYAGRPELLILLAVISAILGLYLRLSSRRRRTLSSRLAGPRLSGRLRKAR